ncbi:hypothetical protein DKZ34_11760 [Limosilactobacillus reuteri]|uniref:hypothetical protein n=1 Tax=Limosilactobacillus reuteri TaxID=1598 RepID=UPI000D6F28D6|nr:hypothetical protein [Limosilactobacillus reuteri]PWT38590.1 hypothetical protein DKZ34_11760 [Limosilactobacillus reuteri]
MKLTEKQKNCPYCHDPFQSIPLFRGEILLQIVEDVGEYRLMIEGNGDPEAFYEITMLAPNHYKKAQIIVEER